MSNLLEQRKWLEGGLAEAYREADKLIISVSSAVLAFSVAFVGQIAKPINTWQIHLSWSAFLIAIAVVLLSLVVEQRERRVRIKKIDKAIKKRKSAFHDVAGAWGTCIFLLNVAGIIAFFGGLLMLAFFLMSNLV